MFPPLITFLIILSILVFIHEFGHFIASKKAGIKVEEFGFGYPPRIFGIKKGETIYSLNWIPFGGFVRILGQEEEEHRKYSKKEIKRAFFSKSKASRAAVLLAGIFGNFVLGIICFSIVYSSLGIPQDLGYVKVQDVIPNSPAQKAGLKPSDKIMAVDSTKITKVDEFIKAVEKDKGKEVLLSTERGNISIVARENPPPNEGRLGVVITDATTVHYSFWKMPFYGAWYGLKEALAWGYLIILGLVLTIKQLFMGVTPQVAGPLGIYQLTSAAAKEGFLNLVQFIGILSVNLAILNVLPFPALDGGHLMFTLFGDFMSKKRRLKFERTVNALGFAFLLTLMILITIQDFIRLFKIPWPPKIFH